MSKQSLPLRHCTVVTKDGEGFRPFVECPYRNGTIDAFECSDCARMTSFDWDVVRGGAVVCEIEDAVMAKNKRPPTDRRADMGEAAIRALVKDIARPMLVSVTPDVTVARLKELFNKQSLRTIVVVDDGGKFQGLISRADLVAAGNGEIVADVMPDCAQPLPEDTPISYAIALMAFADVTEIPVVATEGMVVGVCHAVDALRWVAQRMGYAPAPEEPDATKRESTRRRE